MIGCAPVGEERPIDESPDDLIEEVVEEEPVKEPLEVKLTSEKIKDELLLETTLECEASRGSEDYTYTWEGIDCTGNSCDISIEDMGLHEITCRVDDGEETTHATITLEVIKEQRKLNHIIAIGDSLTYGHGLADPPTENWISLYIEEFSDVQLQNLAFSGSTSWGAREQLQKLDTVEGNKLIFLWIGANDIANFITVEDFKVNYEFMVAHLTALPDNEVVLITIPDVSALAIATTVEEGVNTLIEQLGGQFEVGVKELGKDLIGQYNSVVVDAGLGHDVLVIDMFTAMEEFNQSLISADEFHPNKAGHTEVAGIVADEIKQGFPLVNFI